MLERSPAAEAICITLPGDPRGKGRPRSRIAGNRHGQQFIQVYTDRDTRAYEDRLRNAAVLAMDGHDIMSGPLEVRIVARFTVPASWSQRKRDNALAGMIRPTGKPDWDNLAKSLDALNGVIFIDDSQIVDGGVTKFYDRAPSLSATVRTISPSAADLFAEAGGAQA